MGIAHSAGAQCTPLRILYYRKLLRNRRDSPGSLSVFGRAMHAPTGCVSPLGCVDFSGERSSPLQRLRFTVGARGFRRDDVGIAPYDFFLQFCHSARVGTDILVRPRANAVRPYRLRTADGVVQNSTMLGFVRRRWVVHFRGTTQGSFPTICAHPPFSRIFCFNPRKIPVPAFLNPLCRKIRFQACLCRLFRCRP